MGNEKQYILNKFLGQFKVRNTLRPCLHGVGDPGLVG